MNLLVLDPDADRGRRLETMADGWRMGCTVAASADATVTRLSEAGADLLVLDFDPGSGSALALVRRLRADLDHRHVPVVLLADAAGRDDILAASQAGADGVLMRSLTPDELRQRLLELHRASRRAERSRRAGRIWSQRFEPGLTPPAGPLAVFGEDIDGEVSLSAPDQQAVAAYLGLACDAVARLNGQQEGLQAGYTIMPSTTEVVLSLKRPGLRDAVRLLLVSTACPGNPALTARLFAINRRDEGVGFYLVYDDPEDISKTHRQGLKQLGVRTLSRARIDGERMERLLARHLVPEPSAIAESADEVLPPQQIRTRIVEDIDTMSCLPPLPKVYERISELARDPGSDLKDWIRVLQADPLTCATILRQASSIKRAVQAEIGDIDRAVILLGKNAVVGLVAGTAMGSFLRTIEEKGFRLEELWLHNLAVGFAAQLLSHPLEGEVPGFAEPESLGLGSVGLQTLRHVNLARRLKLDYAKVNAMAAGSLHDIGKAVMVAAYPGLFPLVRDELEEGGWRRPMLDAECEVAGGLTHAVAGDILVQRWELVDQVGRSVLSHHAPQVDDPLSFLVGVADVVGQVLYPFPRDGGWPLAQALEAEDWDAARPFLPAGFDEQPLLDVQELALLVRTIGPRVRRLTEQMRTCLEP